MSRCRAISGIRATLQVSSRSCRDRAQVARPAEPCQGCVRCLRTWPCWHRGSGTMPRAGHHEKARGLSGPPRASFDLLILGCLPMPSLCSEGESNMEKMILFSIATGWLLAVPSPYLSLHAIYVYLHILLGFFILNMSFLLPQRKPLCTRQS